ncbi:MAG: hypothetical protein RLZZ09_3 [Pseudomonadota bacterium]|jgi:type IV secretory pathway TrbD component
MIKYERNLGGWDRGIRLLVGFLLIYLGIFRRDWLGDPVVIGLVIFFGTMNTISAIIGWCPPYSLIGFSTCKTK